MEQSLLHTAKRYHTLYSNKIKTLPIAILMPHSACNCRCVMCDIWKGNKNTKQLTEADIQGILLSLKTLGTKRILMSGGEALLNKNFFKFCELISKYPIKITLLSTGLTLERHAEKIIPYIDEVIVSLDGDETTHDEIRNIKGAFSELQKGVKALKKLKSDFRISARCVIHQLNYSKWDKIILAAKTLGLDHISFLPADVTSGAFNRGEAWEKVKQDTVLIKKEELPLLQEMIETLKTGFKNEFETHFISESPEKIQKIYQYYQAHHQLAEFPHKKCNAPWVSAVIEADGSVRPCFFHDVLGSIHKDSLSNILNSEKSISYRRKLNVAKNTTCVKCVCYLHLTPRNSLF